MAVSTSPSLARGCLAPTRDCSLCSIVGDDDLEVTLPASSLEGLALRSRGTSPPIGAGVGVLAGDRLGVEVGGCLGLPRGSFLRFAAADRF